MTNEQAVEGKTFIIKCVGECGRGIDITLDDGMIFKQINMICAGCSKETKYAIPKATATKFIGLPPGQTSLPAEDKDDDKGKSNAKPIYACSLCEMTFDTPAGLKRHVKNNHNEAEDAP